MRKAIYAPNVHRHKNPIPHASVLNGLMISSAITGIDHKTGDFPQSNEEQIKLTFQNMKAILKAGEASINDIIKIDLYFKDKKDRKLVNPYWVELFPDELTRPSRHAHLSELEGNCIFQIVFTALLNK